MLLAQRLTETEMISLHAGLRQVELTMKSKLIWIKTKSTSISIAKNYNQSSESLLGPLVVFLDLWRRRKREIDAHSDAASDLTRAVHRWKIVARAPRVKRTI